MTSGLENGFQSVGGGATYFRSEDDDENERSGQLAPNKLEQEEMVRMLGDPRNAAENGIGERSAEFDKDGQEETARIRNGMEWKEEVNMKTGEEENGGSLTITFRRDGWPRSGRSS